MHLNRINLPCVRPGCGRRPLQRESQPCNRAGARQQPWRASNRWWSGQPGDNQGIHALRTQDFVQTGFEESTGPLFFHQVLALKVWHQPMTCAKVGETGGSRWVSSLQRALISSMVPPKSNNPTSPRCSRRLVRKAPVAASSTEPSSVMITP